MLGTFGVGKTSLVRRYVYHKFSEDYLSTVGVQLSSKLLTPRKNQKTGREEQLNLIVWDLAHLDKFDNVVRRYLHGAHAAVIVIDLSRPQTISEYTNVINPFFDINPQSPIVLVGNKVDLVEDNFETPVQLESLVKEYNAPLFITSAKTGENVEAAFTTLAGVLL